MECVGHCQGKIRNILTVPAGLYTCCIRNRN